MPNPSSRNDLKEYCLRKLGQPVIEINVADEQVEDRIDDALKMYHDFHYDGIEKTIIKYEITENDKDSGGEWKRYIPLSDNVMSIENVLDLNTDGSSDILFDAEYHLAWDAVYSFNGVSSRFQYYHMSQQNITHINQMISGKKLLRYRRHTDKLYIDMDWDDVSVGNFIIVQAYQIVDPTIYSQVWGDRWLRDYATELIREQWGSNLIKYSGVQMPGGLTFNGEKILEDARVRKKELEEELRETYEEPPKFYMG